MHLADNDRIGDFPVLDEPSCHKESRFDSGSGYPKSQDDVFWTRSIGPNGISPNPRKRLFLSGGKP